jgi:hypothetical protein
MLIIKKQLHRFSSVYFKKTSVEDEITMRNKNQKDVLSF